MCQFTFKTVVKRYYQLGSQIFGSDIFMRSQVSMIYPYYLKYITHYHPLPIVIILMIINSIILNSMHKEAPIPRTPHSTDKIKLKQHASKSLSKYSPGTPSPVINSKTSGKEVRDLGVIK